MKGAERLPLVGGAVIQLRSGKGGEYFSLPLASSNKGWHREWFLIQNFAPKLSVFSGAAPECQECWGWGLTKQEMRKVAPILEQITALKSAR